MKQFRIPQFPAVRGRFRDQDGYAAQAQSKIADMLETGSDQFGVVTEGVGGGYVLDLSADEYRLHPVSTIVCMFKPTSNYTEAADLIRDTWDSTDVEEEEALWSKSLGHDFKFADVAVAYLFDDAAAAAAWLSEYQEDHS